jgi:hypothetical protein
MPAITYAIRVDKRMLGTALDDPDLLSARIQHCVMRMSGGFPDSPNAFGMPGTMDDYLAGSKCTVHGVVKGIPLDWQEVLERNLYMTPMVEGMGSYVTLMRMSGGEYALVVHGYAPLARKQALDYINSGYMPDAADPLVRKAVSNLYPKVRKANEFWARCVAARVMTEALGWDGRWDGVHTMKDRAGLSGLHFVYQTVGSGYAKIPFASLSEAAQSLYLNGTFGVEDKADAEEGGLVHLILAGSSALPNPESPEDWAPYVSDSFDRVVHLGAAAERALDTSSDEGASTEPWELVNHTNALAAHENGAIDTLHRQMEPGEYGATPVLIMREHGIGALVSTQAGERVSVDPPLSKWAAAHNEKLNAVDWPNTDMARFAHEDYVVGEVEEGENDFVNNVDVAYIQSAAARVGGAPDSSNPTLSVGAIVPQRDLSEFALPGMSYHAMTHEAKVTSIVMDQAQTAVVALGEPVTVVYGAARARLPEQIQNGLLGQHLGSDGHGIDLFPGGKRVMFHASETGFNEEFDKRDVLVPASEVAALKKIAQNTAYREPPKNVSRRRLRRRQAALLRLQENGMGVDDPDAKYIRNVDPLLAKAENPASGDDSWGFSSAGYSTFTDGAGSNTRALAQSLMTQSNGEVFPTSASFTDGSATAFEERVERMLRDVMSDSSDMASSSSHETKERAAHMAARAQHRSARRNTDQGLASQARALYAQLASAPSQRIAYPYGRRKYYRMTAQERRELRRIRRRSNYNRGLYPANGYYISEDPLTRAILAGVLTAAQLQKIYGNRRANTRHKYIQARRDFKTRGRRYPRRIRPTRASAAPSSSRVTASPNSDFAMRAEMMAEARAIEVEEDIPSLQPAASSASVWSAPVDETPLEVEDADAALQALYGAPSASVDTTITDAEDPVIQEILETESEVRAEGKSVEAGILAAAAAIMEAEDVSASLSTESDEVVPEPTPVKTAAEPARPAPTQPTREADPFASFAAAPQTTTTAATSTPKIVDANDPFAAFLVPEPVAESRAKKTQDPFAGFGF